MANRQGRIKSVIARNIADIVRGELKKKGLGLISVNEVMVTDDYSLATVYVSFLDPKDEKKKIAELQKCEGFVRSSLARKIDLYKTPKVHFLLDESLASAARIEAALAREEEQLSSLPEDESIPQS